MLTTRLWNQPVVNGVGQLYSGTCEAGACEPAPPKTCLLRRGNRQLSLALGPAEPAMQRFWSGQYPRRVSCAYITPRRKAARGLSLPGPARPLRAGALDCAFKTVAAEGPLGLYKGAGAHFLRVGPHTVLTFLILEQARAAPRPSPLCIHSCVGSSWQQGS